MDRETDEMDTSQTYEKEKNNNENNKETDFIHGLGRHKYNEGNCNVYLFLSIIAVSLGLIIPNIKLDNSKISTKEYKTDRRKYCVYSAYNDVENKNGLLKHVHLVLERIGYEKSSNTTPWSLLWSHDYPFRVLYPNLHRLKPNQMVNHFPGTGFITNKVDLATSNSKYIPKAFKLPANKNEFLKYASMNKNALFLEKHNQHRGVFLKNVSEIDLSSGESFVQEYVQKPFLVDGHKFDIGVYVVLTSVNPLRVYYYKGDVLFRYCPAKYYPFDPKVLDKYVVGDDYLPTWEVPSLTHPYSALGFTMKEAFDTYVRSKGKDPAIMWDEVEKAISEVFLNKEHHIIEALKNYPSGDNFFEMMRFDLVVDEDLKVYLLEANMSPNLSSAHYPPNQLLYEQVLYNLFSLVGVASYMNGRENTDLREQSQAENMVSAQKNIAVWSDECSTKCRDRCEISPVCGLCRPCLGGKLRKSLLKAHKEFLHKGDFKRLFPPEMVQKQLPTEQLTGLNKMNQQQYLWYQGKCNIDITWCK
ncbi:probable tubulin polyglutamylase ttll-15 [Papilio machaon]|uniref:probable tubulin polyglutamylase ttll-15 n=1 Tax=Papilio machaon TaxID=76193 RepID=UPI001E665993|nr:probable tubulin polyglutamylase ttll-15 [Papilio machaon]